MEHRLEKVSYNEIKCSVILATKVFLSFFFLQYFGGSLVVGNKDIPFCHKLWNDLGNDMTDWRERVLDRDSKINSSCCRAEKEYFEERRRSHRQMCFYEGPFPEPYLLAVSETRIAVVDLTSNYSTVVINERDGIKNLTIDPVEEHMYFKSGTKVYRANFDGSDKEVIYEDEENAIRIFALDWIGRRMFWVDSNKRKSIFVGNVNFTNGKDFHASVNNIASLAANPNTGYIFYKNSGSILTRIDFIGEDLKNFKMKDGQSRVYLDYVKKELYYYRKSNTSINICFLDYDGVLLKNISFAEGNVGPLTLFGDFLYFQKMDARVIQEINVSTSVVFRNISLPKPLTSLNDLVIVEKSNYQTDGCPISHCGVNEYCSNMNGSLSCKCHFGFFKWKGSSCEANCKKDLLLIVDTSYSVGSGDFKDNVKPFLKNLVTDSRLEVGPDGTQVGLILFASKDKTNVKLNIGEMKDAQDLGQYMIRLNWNEVSGDRTRTELALKKAKGIFSKASPKNHRPNIADAVVLITDGEPRGRSNTTELTKKYAKELKDKGVLFVTAAVGPQSENPEFAKLLKEVATSPDFFLNVQFDSMDEMLGTLVAMLCIKPGQCLCNGNISSPFCVPHGQSKAVARWVKPYFTCATGGKVTVESTIVQPPLTSPHAFSPGKYTINYTYNLKGAVSVTCPFTIIVKGELCRGKDFNSTIQ